MRYKKSHALLGVYQIVCNVDGKIYVGSSKRLSLRKKSHWSALRMGKHGNSHLQNAWNKYGENNFIFDVLELVEDYGKLKEREQIWLDSLNSYDDTVGYNLAQDAERPRLGVVAWNKNKTHEPAVCAEMSRQKKALVASGWKPWNVGKTYKCPNISRALSGIPMKESTKEKLSEKFKNRIFTEEHRANLTKALIKRWNDKNSDLYKKRKKPRVLLTKEELLERRMIGVRAAAIVNRKRDYKVEKK